MIRCLRPGPGIVPALLSALVALAFTPTGAAADPQVTAFKLAVAEAASADADIAAFYRGNGYRPLWTAEGELGLARRAALMAALAGVRTHGLPAARYDAAALMRQMREARSDRDMGQVEVALSRTFVKYARDVQSGILVPSRIDKGIVRRVQYRDRTAYLAGFANSDPGEFIAALPPARAEYRALRKAGIALNRVLEQGGWGPPVPARKLTPGQTGDAVIALRNRLIAMGYLKHSAARTYDVELQKAVQRFQIDHGLDADGVAGSGTIGEINKPAVARLQSVIVALERERWLNRDLGRRHVLVNLADFSTRLVDDGRVTFQTRSVVGKNTGDRRSPEFSDLMEHMVINPSWYVPRSIIVKEYLPMLQRNPNAVSHIEITDRSGRLVDRANTDFTQFSRGSFPFAMRQPPSRRNALGLVKFMFPNKYNIYLHDTPQKNLFQREVRDFSHGCIRLADPFDFAYALLARQTDDPEALFQSILKTGKETTLVLEQPVPVHLIYRTAFTDGKGRIGFRRDVYGRDAKIWNALERAGVATGAVQG